MPEKDETQKAEKTTWEGVVVRVIKIALIIGAVLFILLTALSQMGGNSDVLREAIEDYISNNTPYTAHISKLNNMRFFPDVVIDVADVDLRAGADGQGETAIRIAKARVVMAFFDMLFSPGKFKDITIENLQAASGSLLAKPLDIESVNVADEAGQSQVQITGKIGTYPLQAHIGLRANGDPGRRVYSIGAEKPFDASIGDLKVEGTLRSAVTGAHKLENLIIGVGGQQAVRGNLDWDNKGAGRHAIKGQLRVEPGKSQLDPNIVVDLGNDPPSIFGVVRSESIVLDDFRKSAPLIKTLDAFKEIFGHGGKEGLDINAFAFDLNFDFKNISSKAVKWGDIKTPMKSEEGALRIGPLKGRIVGGNLGGDIVLTDEGGTTKLTEKISIKDFDYAALQKQFMEQAKIDGTAHIAVNLQSKGKTLKTLVDNLSGKASFIGGKAHMPSNLLNVWGGGLLNALLPDFSPEQELNVNCVVVNMDIEDLKARSDAVFVDTQRITLNGEGTYDFKNDQLEMLLEPKAKDIAIGDISSAVNVSGPLSDLKTSPNVFSLGKKVGGLLLGTVNPAFFALSLADLNLSENHPCKEFIIEQEELPAPDYSKAKQDEELPAQDAPAPAPETASPTTDADGNE